METTTVVGQDTPFPSLSGEDLPLVRCSTCNRYLSYAPITVNLAGDSNCGRCTDFAEQPQIKISAYETLAKYVEFPCIFDFLGCDEKIRFCDVPKHEATCNFREVECPARDCQERKCVQVIKDHFVKEHANLVIKNAQFELPQEEDLPTTNILNVDGLSVLLQIRPNSSNSSGKYDLVLGLFTQTPEMEIFKCGLKSTSRENSRSLTIDMPQLCFYQPRWKYSEQDVLTLDLSSLQSLLGSKKISFEIVRDRTPIQDQSDKSASINLECNVCAESMKPPIYICKTGHSICSSCRRKVNVCPSCQAIYEGTRNYQLEELAEPKAISPGSKSPTCPANGQETPRNEYICPLTAKTSCGWKGALEEMYKHVNMNHALCTVLRFDEPIKITFAKQRSWIFVSRFDGKPFIIYLNLTSDDSFSCKYFLQLMVSEVDVKRSQDSSHRFSLSVSPQLDGEYRCIRQFASNSKEVMTQTLVSMDTSFGVNLMICAQRVAPSKCPYCYRIIRR